MKPYRWTWDGRSFVAPKTSFRTEPNAPDPPVTQIAVKKGQNVRLVLNNPTGMTHPFHIHGRHFQLLYQSPNNAGDYKDGPLNLQAPCEKDTISVQAGGHAVIQWKEKIPVSGFSIATSSGISAYPRRQSQLCGLRPACGRVGG